METKIKIKETKIRRPKAQPVVNDYFYKRRLMTIVEKNEKFIRQKIRNVQQLQKTQINKIFNFTVRLNNITLNSVQFINELANSEVRPQRQTVDYGFSCRLKDQSTPEV